MEAVLVAAAIVIGYVAISYLRKKDRTNNGGTNTGSDPRRDRKLPR